MKVKAWVVKAWKRFFESKDLKSMAKIKKYQVAHSNDVTMWHTGHTGVVGGLIVSGTGMIDVVTAKLFQFL